MPSTTVNPTRQELTRLKNRLRTSIRGHKLLKDKRDELMKQFMDVVRENRALRKRVEEGLMRAHGSFTVAAALMSPEMLEQSLLYPKQSVELTQTSKNIMSVNVPVYHFKTKSDDAGEIYPYGFANTSGELDDAVSAMSQVFQDMLKLAEIEKTSQLLAEEIEKTRRRVNALEYVKIPEMQENIKYITMKLAENYSSLYAIVGFPSITEPAHTLCSLLDFNLDILTVNNAAEVRHTLERLQQGGYRMVVNEESSNVSQGQKQLLTIARTILADNRILILDEATSSVDTRTEQRIQTAMDRLMEGRTSFVIAHRLSTIRDADLILVMRDGDIVEQGTHDQLMEAGGFYADLYNSQFEKAS